MFMNPAVPGIEEQNTEKKAPEVPSNWLLVKGRSLNLFLYHTRVYYKIELMRPKGHNAQWWQPTNRVQLAAQAFQDRTNEIAAIYHTAGTTAVQMDREAHRKWVAAHANSKCTDCG